MMLKRCFVTVGTTRFDELCYLMVSSEVNRVLKRLGCERVVLQVGSSDVGVLNFIKDGISYEMYRYKDSIDCDIEQSDVVISHAGAGSCLEVLEKKKPLLVVINENLMDNHQIELADQLQIDRHLYYCTSSTLVTSLENVDFASLVPMPKADTTMFINYLDNVFRTSGS